MAGYREHISVSGLLGVVYGAAAYWALHFTPEQAIIAGCLTWIAGMLPDLDSDTGRPVREIFNLLGTICPLVLLRRLMAWTSDMERVMLVAILIYIGVRYGGAYLLGKLSVHRGMFHSIPAMLIAGELSFLAYQNDDMRVRFLMAMAVVAGFLSHLVLDEIYAVQWTGFRVRLNQFAGSAVKFSGKSHFANLITYGLLTVLTYAAISELGLIEQPDHLLAPARQAVKQTTERL